MLIILAMTVVGCELLSPTRWAEYEQDRAERGVEWYRKYNGNVYWKDKFGNKIY